MKPLILTTDSSAAGGLWAAGLADLTITLTRRLVWGPAPSASETATLFAARKKTSLHWQDYTPPSRLEKCGGIDLGLIEFCARYDLGGAFDENPKDGHRLSRQFDRRRAKAQMLSLEIESETGEVK